MRDELCHGGTSQRFEKGCSSGDGSPEQCRRPRYNGRVSGPRFHRCMGFWPAGPPCTCCVYLHPSHLRFPLRCPLTDTLTLADGTPESSQRTMYSSTSPASAHTHTWQVMCRMKTQKWRTAPYRHLIASEKIIVKHARRQKRKRSSHITYQPSSFRSGISCRCSGRSSPIGADSRPLPRLASSRHPRRLRGKTSS